MESNLKDFTEKEATAYDKSLSKMYKPTGVKLDDLMNEALDKALDKASEQEIQIRLGKHFGIKNICIPNVLMTGEYRKEILPEELYKKHKDEIQKRVAGIAGIITVSYDCKIDAKAPKRKDVEPLTDTQIKDFMRIGCMKWFKGVM